MTSIVLGGSSDGDRAFEIQLVEDDAENLTFSLRA